MNLNKTLTWFARWPAEQKTALAAVALGTLIFVPYLGAVGLWDCWETHYGEVAREMIERRDLIHPHYEQDWFFSKPALTMWLQAMGMWLAATFGAGFLIVASTVLTPVGVFLARREQVRLQFVGVLALFTSAISLLLAAASFTLTTAWKFGNLIDDDGALPLLFEWGFRLPSTIFSIFSLGLLAWALTRVVNARVALATVFVFATMPLCFLIIRQAVTDPPLVAATICGVSCALVALFDAATRHRAHWWYGAWVSFALATLAKGWLGFLIPAAVFGAYVLLYLCTASEVSASLAWLRAHFIKRFAVALAIGLVVAFIAARFAAARETVFISAAELGGPADSLATASNWFGLTIGSLATWGTATFITPRKTKAPPLIALLQEMRLGSGVLVFLLVALPWYFEMFTFRAFDDENKHFWLRFIVHDHLSRFFSGVFTSTPGGTFTYFIEQGGFAIFPWVVLVPGALSPALRLTTSDTRGRITAIAVLWLLIGFFAVADSATKFHHYVFVTLPPLSILIGLFIDEVWVDGLDAHRLAIIAGVPLFLLVGKDVWAHPKHFTDLFVFNYDRPYPDFLDERPLLFGRTLKDLLRLGFTSGLVAATAAAFLKSKRGLFGVVACGSLFFALWFSWSHWVDLSAQWTQRDQFWRYFTQRRPGETIAAYQMNWRGETLYSRNHLVEIGSKPGHNDVAELQAFANRAGRKWAITEHARVSGVINALGGHSVKVVNRDLNNKFALLLIDD